MADYDYAIGLTNPPTNVEDLATPVNPPKGRFSEYGILIDKGNGHVGGHGFPTAIWHFDILTQAMVDQLRTFCPGPSGDVFITTRILSGNYAIFSGVMIWPSQVQLDARNMGGRYLGLEFEFRKLERVTSLLAVTDTVSVAEIVSVA